MHRIISKTALLLAIVTICVSCQILNKTAPLKSDMVIAPLNVYESSQDRALARKYRNNCKNIYKNIRSHFKPSQLEFFLISGICFRGLQIKKTFDMYLSINTKTSQVFRNDKTSFEERAITIFNHYLKKLLVIAAQENEVLQDKAIAGIMVNTRWQLEETVTQYRTISFEQLTLAVQKQAIAEYTEQIINDQELLNQSTIIAIKANDIPRIIKLQLDET